MATPLVHYRSCLQGVSEVVVGWGGGGRETDFMC